VVVDTVGNARNVSWMPPTDWATQGCQQGVQSLCPASPIAKKKTPGFELAFLVAAFAVVLALRRRRD